MFDRAAIVAGRSWCVVVVVAVGVGSGYISINRCRSELVNRVEGQQREELSSSCQGYDNLDKSIKLPAFIYMPVRSLPSFTSITFSIPPPRQPRPAPTFTCFAWTSHHRMVTPQLSRPSLGDECSERLSLLGTRLRSCLTYADRVAVMRDP